MYRVLKVQLSVTEKSYKANNKIKEFIKEHSDNHNCDADLILLALLQIGIVVSHLTVYRAVQEGINCIKSARYMISQVFKCMKYVTNDVI